jgi:ubiquinone/menaquinone biosynthesis C-methylase UbiE
MNPAKCELHSLALLRDGLACMTPAGGLEFTMDQAAHTAAAEQRFSDARAARRWADMYDSDTESLQEASFRKRCDVTVKYVLQVLPAGGHVLDLGCGSAPVLSQLRKQGVSCTGLEYSEDMLRHSRARLQSMQLDEGDLHRGDCRSTQFESASFDVVVCLGVISYVEDYAVVLSEIKRVLKPGGYAFVSFRNRFNPILWDPIAGLKTLARAATGRLRPEPYKIGRFMDFQEFRRKMDDAGFEYRDFVGIGLGPVKFNRRVLLAERTSIRLSDALTAVLHRLGWQAPLRWLADVSLWIYSRPPGRA